MIKKVKIKKTSNQYRPLISIEAGYTPIYSEPDAVTFGGEAFSIIGYTGLWINERSSTVQAGNFFASRSARTPGNLLNHVQRINHQILKKSPEGVYGAILDLFIVLRDRGRPLRERMLSQSRSLLNNEWFVQLDQRLEQGITELDALPPCHTSLLSRGISGTHRLVKKVEVGSGPSVGHDKASGE